MGALNGRTQLSNVFSSSAYSCYKIKSDSCVSEHAINYPLIWIGPGRIGKGQDR